VALMPVADALAKVLEDAGPLATETVGLEEACGRVLAQDLAARRTQPPADVSAMDGYAVRAADVTQRPVTLTVIGEIAAGRPFTGRIEAGQAARIFTGGVMPDGADSVVIQEDTQRHGDAVVINYVPNAGAHIRRAGIDFKEGATLLTRGQRLNERDLMVAAAMNYPQLPVYRRPRLHVFGTGDELVPPGTQPQAGEIVYSNGYGLAALARQAGAEVSHDGIVRDDLDAIIAAVRRARDGGADILATTGGASVGDYDLVQQALAAEGMQLTFWKLALRPGKPMMRGRLGRMHVLGLPGNPVSSFVCSFLFLLPLIRRLSGLSDVETCPEPAILGRALRANDVRAEYLRATLSRNHDGDLVATPFTSQDSSLMATLSRAECLVIRPPHAPAAQAGERCDIVKLGL